MKALKYYLALFILLTISVGFNFYQYNHPREVDIIGKTIFLPGKDVPGETKFITLPNGNQAAITKAVQAYKEKSQEAEVLLNSVKPIIPEKDVSSIISVDSKLQLELDNTKLAVNDKEKEIKVWKDKYNSITIDNANNTAKTTSDVSPKIINSEKRDGFLQPKISYTTVTSENPSILFNGIQSYTFKNPIHKDFVELNLRFQASYNNKNLTPILGAEFQFNPDGKLKYLAGYNYYYDHSTGKFTPYYLAGFQYNLFRF